MHAIQKCPVSSLCVKNGVKQCDVKYSYALVPTLFGIFFSAFLHSMHSVTMVKLTSLMEFYFATVQMPDLAGLRVTTKIRHILIQ